MLACVLLFVSAPAAAQDVCRFAIEGASMRLLGDCVTHAPLEVPDGLTFDGDFHTIVAADPPGGLFLGPVIRARGGTASVINTIITTEGLAGVCQEGAGRLRGISFEGTSGLIRGNTIDNIRKPGSGCEEGTAIEVRHTPGAGAPARVLIESNLIARYQKSGIVLHGHVDGVIARNMVGASASQTLVVANTLQIGPLARATVEENTILGNSYRGGGAAATAILLAGAAPGTTIASNVIAGNADVGIHVMADGAIVTDNELLDEGADGDWDIGIVNLGVGNVFAGNETDGYRTPDLGIEHVTEDPEGQSLE